MLTISTLTPNEFRINIKVKVIELLITLETKHEKSNSMIIIHEYLVGDESGCIILNTKQELKIDSTYTIKNGYTETIEGYLRLYAEHLEPTTASLCINVNNNRSFVHLERDIKL
ncbi:uncharacterized protein BX663DRAFT_525635 [Cokeromyces recurvatus]|uniref:uncharacterized protein n=1 Tax=Cokeromyces recurvatus TaxID=90255 RepID=UPI0022203E7A|nr:uncharacterized protein BX663DRAFT_525635 [Cokeromyces recurvatus]KAI7898223.1 hypothetical protein BX663DRAFT_525635 [Cokeromyces recurvatus]